MFNSSNPNSVSVEAVDVEMTTEQCVETSKGAIKRKAEDYNPSDTVSIALQLM